MLKEVVDSVPLISAFLVVLGWPAAFFFARLSEISSRRRDRRVDNLFVVFQKLNELRMYSADPELDVKNILKEIGDRLELFGSSLEVHSFRIVAEQLLNKGGDEIHHLINLIRNDLRNLLSMERIRSPVAYFSVSRPRSSEPN